MFMVPDDYVLMLPSPFPKRNTCSTVQIATLPEVKWTHSVYVWEY